MTQNVHLNPKEHRDLRIRPGTDSELVATLGHSVIVSSEIFIAASAYPILMMHDPDHDKFVLTPLFCLEAGRNLFVESGEWSAPYVPLDVRRRPFVVAVAPDGQSADVLINMQSDLVGEHGPGERMYSESGDETVFLQRTKQILATIVQAQAQTDAFISTLRELSLIAPLVIQLSTDQGPRRITGLYGLDQARMAAIGPTELGQLHAAGVLQDTFIMQGSYAQLQRLVWMENRARPEHTINAVQLAAED